MPIFVIHQCSECDKEHRAGLSFGQWPTELPSGWRKDDHRLFCGIGCHAKYLNRLHFQATCQHPPEQRQYDSPGLPLAATQIVGKRYTCRVCGIREVEFTQEVGGGHHSPTQGASKPKGRSD